jgi:1,4-alpha-glucan branching enzyme
MIHQVQIHYDNRQDFSDPRLWVWVKDGATLEKELLPTGRDSFGIYFDLKGNRSGFNFKFKDGGGRQTLWEGEHLNRSYHAQMGREIWTMAQRHNVYHVPPAEPVGDVRHYYHKLSDLVHRRNFHFPDTDVSGEGAVSMLGANLLTDGSILFGFFHPRAARVYLVGSFNDWQCPGHFSPNEEQFIEMGLYSGFHGQPNIWLARLDSPPSLERLEYKFYLQGGATEMERYVVDPYTRVYSDDYRHRNSVVVDPTRFQWTDDHWRIPALKDLILYELSVYGFTDNDPEIEQEHQGTFQGVIQRIKQGYFHDLGVNAIALMPVAEVPNKGGLGYEPCTFMAVEKDFGTPDELREMVDTAHRHGLAVIIDQVFNHTSNDFNPLWNLVDDGSSDGGFYFEGKTMWGNRVATGRAEVDNMLIDSCKMMIKEYHVDGFRFDATHSYFLNHALLHRLAHEIKDKGFKADAILIAENLPNETDLNLDGFNGFAQWSDIFHDKIKALLREGDFEGVPNTPEQMGTMVYFSKDSYAAHTNNTVNYCESHDENSVPYEVATGGAHLQHPWIKERKARLGMMATMTALGQPMIYMGQEYGIERERNIIDVNWAKHAPTCHFYNWTRRLIRLRSRYESLRLSGYNPADEGLFTWVLGPWMGPNKGGGHRIIGWRLFDRGDPQQRLLVMLNFEGEAVPVEVDFHIPGRWVKLADLDCVNDLPPDGSKLPGDPDSIDTPTGLFAPFILPGYSAFIYRHHTGS